MSGAAESPELDGYARAALRLAKAREPARAALAGAPARAEEVSREVMARSVALWRPLERRLAEGRRR